MFFVSEEFLRKYEEDGAIDQTIGAAVPVGEELFEDAGGKGAHNRKRKRSSAVRAPNDRNKRATQDTTRHA